jgi:chemotaxis protein methyltransferase CheR
MRMDAALDEANLLRFAELIDGRLGLRFDDSSLKELAAILPARARSLRCASVNAYLHRFNDPGSMHDELRALATMLTIGETYFFRSPEQFTVFSEVALPCLARTQPGRNIRILSAGCATGEEAYTFAITLRELGPSAPAHVSILGVDLNAQSITVARRGRYSARAMRATPPGYLAKYFRRDREQFVLDQNVRAMVQFEERNLAIEDHGFWRPQSFDVIFCRNVTMYLSARALGEVIARFARMLAPDGFLFLSYTEPLRGISQAFQVEHCRGAFYYKLSDPNASPAVLHEVVAPPAPVALKLKPKAFGVPTAPLPLHAALAVHDLSTPPLDSTNPASLSPSPSLAAAFMMAERFDEALTTIESMPPASRAQPDVLLLTAMIQIERGRLDDATKLCAALLALDHLNAGAHYLTALCHEQRGRRAAAVDSYRVGVYLDQAFAMPHLRLGLMFRREGDLRGARRELQNASALLAQEDPARVLLFGGGFSRDTLIDLCASELRLCQEST